MRIEHVAMYVDDLENAKDFFITYFHATANEGYYNKLSGFRSYFLSFDNEVRIEIMNRPDMIDNKKPFTRTGYSHIAFALGCKEAVDELTNRLKTDGYKVVSGPRTTGDGYYESCIVGIEGNIIEITE